MGTVFYFILRFLTQDKIVAITIYKTKCIGCGTCATNCIMGAITMIDDKAEVNPAKCALCGRCVNECQQNAPRYQ